ncbi:FeoA family protein [Mobilicoccus caccae]|uniref:Ferrous iron transporter FeoA-like domain-containing protein n=1 Tax=Mobilicoccus caccae TaxID=1859295 RepID=A0ABQ6ITN9_9MICO|nr:FeoA family protein [Mobilicoccus caccae]GMA41300.1 hypothetical protein GCM10025883_33450 [Mobilicoccus caccae]
MSESASVLAGAEIPAGSRPGPLHVTLVPGASARVGRRMRRRRASVEGTLAAVPAGSRVVVTGVGGDLEPAAARRLVDLGFAPGASVEVLRRAPLGDPTIFRVADTEIALRRRHAAAIRVDVRAGIPAT